MNGSYWRMGGTRSNGGRCVTKYNKPLTATELYELLNKPVCRKLCLCICAKFKTDSDPN